MSKRTTPEQHVISYFMSQPVAAAQQMLDTVKAIVRQRQADDSAKVEQVRPTPRKRKRTVRQALAPRPVVAPMEPVA